MKVKISKRFNSSILGVLFQNQCEENNIYCFFIIYPKKYIPYYPYRESLWGKSLYIFLINKNCQR